MMEAIRRLPVLPTVIVLIAVGIMLRLGFWQLDRRANKEALLASYAVSQGEEAIVEWPSGSGQIDALLYRHSKFDCRKVRSLSSMAGMSATGASGLAVTAECTNAEGVEAKVVLGWSREPVTPDWRGGDVIGIIAPGPRLIADPPLAGLGASAAPDPSEIPNNHLSYAVQWFLFASVALVIYALAVRKRLAGSSAEG